MFHNFKIDIKGIIHTQYTNQKVYQAEFSNSENVQSILKNILKSII